MDVIGIPSGPAVLDILPRLREALAGESPLIPYAVAAPLPAVPETGGALPDGLALCVGTSGSTGTPKLAMLTADALMASASATHQRLGGAGQWLLPMPAHHVAGLQVLVRSILACTDPVVMDLSEGFTAKAFAEAASAMTGPRRYTAVVPTQLVRLLDEPSGVDILASFDGVLVGGAAVPPALLRQARAAGAVTVTTYGMSETAGGCVYDGIPLSCSAIRLSAEGQLQLGGDTLASGYLGRPDLTEAAFRDDPAGSRWFTTGDVGHQDDEGAWHVDGRIDDLINTGGLKVAPRLVEDAIATHLAAVAEVVVLGTPDRQWGEAVSAAVVLRDGASSITVTDLRTALRGILPDHALPRRLITLTAIPLRGPGKPDRRALARELAR